ncbi:hypothetical protein [Actinoplanes sp. NPDC089786]|uniref:hypothetical protein n=1 Tax=Actinoplanes sp. NPDC089786 TaxID=3155185 RepID=UPI003422EF07
MPIRSAVRVLGHPQTTVVLRGVDGPPEAVVTALPREPGRHTVIVAADPPLAVAELATLLAERLPVGCESIRLVLSHSGRPDVARPLSDRLRIEVIAPSGAVMLLPGGRVFVSGGGWNVYRPGRPPIRQGPRHPSPSWDLPETVGFAATPSGAWLHGGAGPVLPPAVLAIPVDPDQPTVVVGHPGAPLDDAAGLDALPKTVRRRLLLLVPYGPDSARLHRVAERLASRDGGTIEVLAGVPDTGADGAPALTTVDASGHRGWQPWGTRFRYRAAAAPELVNSRLPSDAGGAAGFGGLTVEVVRAGLWLRGDHDPELEAARRVPADAHPLLVLGSAAQADIVTLPGRVAALAPLLPGLRLVVTSPPVDGRAAGWRSLTETYGPLLVTVGDGELAVLPAAEQLGTGEYPLITPRVPASAAPTPAPASPVNPPPTTVHHAPSPGDALKAGPVPVQTLPAPAIPLEAVRLAAVEPTEPADDPDGRQRELAGTALSAAWLPPAGSWAAGRTLATEGPARAANPDVAPADAAVLVWTVAGQRRDDRTVEFGAGTRFRVLAVDGPADQPSLVLLRELSDRDGRSDDAVRESLRRVAAARERATATVG